MPADLAALAAPAARFQPGLKLDFRCHDVDEMAERMLFWGVEVEQLGRGRFESGIRGIHSPRIQLSTGYRDPGVVIRGAIPARAFTLSSVVRQESPIFLRGAVVGPRDLALVDGRQELDFRSVAANEMATLSVEAEWFRAVAGAMLGCDSLDRRDTDRLALAEDASRERLNRALLALLDEARRQADRLSDPAYAQAWELRVLDAVLLEVETWGQRPTATSRRVAAQQAESYLWDSKDRPVSIGELCLAIGAPKRTLMLGFQEAFGLSPIAYHKRLRLNQARRDLLRARAGNQTVAAVALRWGFEHFGRFAIDYRQMFGESPVETLRA